MNSPRLLLASICLAVIACGMSSPSEARDRPGTPNKGFTWYCASTLDERPAICAEFQNTATEDVGFMMEWTENGRLLTPDLSGRSECISRSAQFYHCTALQRWFVGVGFRGAADKLSQMINPVKDPRFQSHRDYPEGFRVTNLAYDAEYCFRFRAIDRYGVWSGAWSGFTCARTPSPPEEPVAPLVPKVTGIQPTSGAGAVGAGTPFKVLVEWSRPADVNQLGWYSVERWRDQRWITVPKRVDPARFGSGTEYEYLVEDPFVGAPTERHAFRVCAENVEHRACSPAGWYYAFAHGKERLTGEVNRTSAGPQKPVVLTANSAIAQASIAPSDRVTANYNPSVASAQSVGTPVAALPDLDALAARGVELSMQDPLAAELRNRTAESIRRGFDIGLGIWAGNTAPGAGKQRVHDALSAIEQPGFDIAAAFSLPRNKYAALAGVGAAIGNADQDVANARNAENDVFFWLGFDIASGIFGDPKAGAKGNTATGSGSLGIRNELNAAGQRGFNAATALHLSRSYR